MGLIRLEQGMSDQQLIETQNANNNYREAELNAKVSTDTIIDIAHGGTGATTAAQARANLGAVSNAAPTITALTLGYDCDALADAYAPAYYKNALGEVCLRGGFTRNRSAYSGMIAVLPVGFRPSKQIGVAISNGHSILIFSNGQIYPTTPQGSSDYLDGVRFLADS